MTRWNAAGTPNNPKGRVTNWYNPSGEDKAFFSHGEWELRGSANIPCLNPVSSKIQSVQFSVRHWVSVEFRHCVDFSKIHTKRLGDQKDQAAPVTVGFFDYPHVDHSLEFVLYYIFVFGQPIGSAAYHYPWGCLDVVFYEVPDPPSQALPSPKLWALPPSIV